MIKEKIYDIFKKYKGKIILVAVIIGAIGAITLSIYITDRINDRKIDEYQSTITQLGKQLGIQKLRNQEITELNTRITERYEQQLERLGEAETIADSIDSGLSDDVDAIRRIREDIKSVIEEFGESKETP